jgi:GNAT superfamily N-acetyltransferase
VRDTDEQKLTDFFYSLSESTVYKRWMRPVPRMPHADMLRYLDVDDHDNVAIVVEAEAEGREPELIGVGRYHNDRATNFAEVAFVVRDDWQHQGLGTALLAHLVEIAKQSGISGFVADVLATNAEMMRVFHKSGLPVETRLEGGVYGLKMPFGPDRPRR